MSDAPVLEILEIDGVAYDRCPMPRVTRRTRQWIEDAVMVKALGMPLEAGGLNDQDNRDAQALTMIFSALQAPREE